MPTTLTLLAFLVQAPAFDARAAEHLLNRAGFGAGRAEVQAAVEAGLPATLDALFAPRERATLAFTSENLAVGGVLGAEPLVARAGDDAAGGADGAQAEAIDGAAMEDDADARAAREAERRAELARRRVADQRQLGAYTHAWLETMVRGDDPLRDRMTLFWHGHFTSSMQNVRSSHALIRQHQFLREHALGDFRVLLDGVLSDPAMLVYLDNHRNARGRINENLARELLELFTLGEGHYTEDDVREAARALTGRTARRGEYVFVPRRHDDGTKELLGRRGRFDGSDLVDLLLDTPRTAEFVARELLLWFEGVEPDDARTARYARALRDAHWRIGPVLRRLFEDPDFYRPEVVGARVASPVDFLVGTVRRLGASPPPRALELAARLLGERLFWPPTVEGWHGGEAWITTSTALARGNVAGVLTGSIGAYELLGADEDAGGEPADGDAMQPAAEGQRARRPRLDGARLRELTGGDPVLSGLGREARGTRITPPDPVPWLVAAGAHDDATLADALLDQLLAIEPPADTRDELVAYIAKQRELLSLPAGSPAAWNEDGRVLLARLCHRVLALPEANLH